MNALFVFVRRFVPSLANAIRKSYQFQFGMPKKLCSPAPNPSQSEDELIAKGSACLEHGKFGAAKKFFETVVEANPNNLEGIKGLWKTLEKSGNLQDFPKNINPTKNNLKIFEGILFDFMKAGNYPKFAEYSGKIISFDPANRCAATHIAFVLRERRRPDDALVALNKLIEADPTYVSALVIKGICLLEQGKREEALADFDTACTICKEGKAKDSAEERFYQAQTMAFYYKARTLQLLRRMDESEALCDEIIGSKFEFFRTWELKSIHDLEKRSYKHALQTYSKALEQAQIDLPRLKKNYEALQEVISKKGFCIATRQVIDIYLEVFSDEEADEMIIK